MNLTVTGLGYLGLVHAASMADLGHNVLGMDTDAGKIIDLTNGKIPFHEPGLEQLVRKNLENKRLRFTSSEKEVAQFGDVHFICVGTPEGKYGRASMVQFDAAMEMLLPHCHNDYHLIVVKSTVPPGTSRRWMRVLAWQGRAVEMASNPEFLREGTAIQDTLNPERLVFGVQPDGHGEEILKQVYRATITGMLPRVFIVDFETAELSKLASNAFLATKISFINGIGEIAEESGGDIRALSEILGTDSRIGRDMLTAGLGFGGGCLPKDIRALRAFANDVDADRMRRFLNNVDWLNKSRRERLTELAETILGGVEGKIITVLGISFKPGTDDTRDSPAAEIAERLSAKGAMVMQHDPSTAVTAAETLIRESDLVILATDWPEYAKLDPETLESRGKKIIDARCFLPAKRWRTAGWQFYVLGDGRAPGL